MSTFNIDSHKLMYHVERVNAWLNGGDIFPVYAEVGLFGGCNHRCAFCAFDFLKYKPVSLSEKHLRRFILQAAKNGLKAILFSGEGEPLLHKKAAEIIRYTKQCNIDTALVTNGVLFDRETAAKTLGHLSWLKVSLDAAKRSTYAFVHGTDAADFDVVIHNIRQAVKIKKKSGYDCVIGVQSILMPQNFKEMAALAELSRRIGADYLVIKPYCPHISSKSKARNLLKDKDLLGLQKKLEKYSDGRFRVIFRNNALQKIGRPKPYKECLGLPFMTHISANGDVYPCNAFVGNRRFCFGNITKNSFMEIWGGKKRKLIMSSLNSRLDVNSCRNPCRLDEVNRYLWELKNPIRHVNFI